MWINWSGCQRNSFTGPLVGFGHCPVEVVNELVDLSSEIVFRSEVSAFDNFSGHYAKPDLHLVKPAAVFRSIGKPDTVARIAQKRLTRSGILQDAWFSLDSKLPFEIDKPGHQPDQGLWLVSVKLIVYENPLVFRSNSDL